MMTRLITRRPIEERRWYPIYILFRGHGPGHVVTYGDMEAVLPGFDIDNDRMHIHRAMKELLVVDKRGAENVRGVGYKIVEAVEHYRLADQKRLQARRKITKGRRLLKHYRREEVTTEEAQQLDEFELVLGRHEDALRRIKSRHDRNENLVQTAKREQRNANESVRQINKRIKRLEEMMQRHPEMTFTDEEINPHANDTKTGQG